MPSRDATERILIARKAGHDSWATCDDRDARTAPGRRAFLDRFEKQVDPDGTLDPIERAKRAENARRAHMTGLALASARSRRRAKEARAAEREADRALAEALERGGGATP